MFISNVCQLKDLHYFLFIALNDVSKKLIFLISVVFKANSFGSSHLLFNSFVYQGSKSEAGLKAVEGVMKQLLSDIRSRFIYFFFLIRSHSQLFQE